MKSPGSSPRSDSQHGDTDLLYGVDDTPPWYTSIILGFQVTPHTVVAGKIPVTSMWGVRMNDETSDMVLDIIY